MIAPPLSRARVTTCILINLSATPGLGSLMCRRFFAGTGQLLLALAGFFLITGWMLVLFYGMWHQALDEPVAPVAYGWMWKWGSIFFGAGWLWSLVTSINLLRQTKHEKVPPKLADLPKTGKS
jgi:hypothetical protein